MVLDPKAPSGIDSKAPFLERFLFANRVILLILFACATLFFGYQASHLRMQASFEKMVPNYHPFLVNALKHSEHLAGMSNSIWIAVENSEGDIYDAEYLDVLRQVTDEVSYIKGIDRTGLLSLWMAAVRWTTVTKDGFAGGPIIGPEYDGSAASLDQVKINIDNAGIVGKLVGLDGKSSMVVAPLLERHPETGELLDYTDFSRDLEAQIRDRFENDKIKIHLVGFSKLVGDLIEGATGVLLFFAITVLLTMAMLFWHTGCIRCTLMPLVCALVAVIWQTGMLYTLGFGLDPYSMLIPFLVFAIGVSHGVQMINGVKHHAALGQNAYDSARLSFRILYIPALCALITDGVGFAILYVIKIGVLQDVAIGSLIGFPVLILLMLVCLPLLMSYAGVSKKSVNLMHEDEERQSHPIWAFLSNFGRKRGGIPLMVIVAVGVFFGMQSRQNLQIGDLDRGAPELRENSRYNLDNAYLVDHYGTTSDLFVIMVECYAGNEDYETLVAVERLQWKLDQLEGVQSTTSRMDVAKALSVGFSEGYPKWYGLPRDQESLRYLTYKSLWQTERQAREKGDFLKISVYLNDHKASTLSEVVSVVEQFAAENDGDKFKFLMAAGPAGIEAATNMEIEKAENLMLMLVYGAVSFLVFLTFRCLRATICIMIPLVITTILCEALMPLLGIGVKVATLPVITVGVGIGVDYGIYIYTRLISHLNEGMGLYKAYYHTLKTTGKAVGFTGITLALGVFTWTFSPIKFQADMGILLTFMFLWNMIGAVCLLPALARYVLPRRLVVGFDSEESKNGLE
jgi:predicted RND superfamily exporter protein